MCHAFQTRQQIKKLFNCYKFITIQYRYKTVTHTAEILVITPLQNIIDHEIHFKSQL